MQHDELIGQIQYHAPWNSRGNAEVAATRATLEALAEPLARYKPSNAAAQLLKGMADYLRYVDAGSAERFCLDEFFRPVGVREGVDLPQAVCHARVVMEVLQEAISKDEIDDIRPQLPEEFNFLFEAGSQGNIPVHA